MLRVYGFVGIAYGRSVSGMFLNKKRELFMKNNRKAFTLVELLVVISIIAMLMAVLLPSLNKARTQAKNVICCSNQKQIATAIHTYAASNDGKLFMRYDEDNYAIRWKNATPYSWPEIGMMDLMMPYIQLIDVCYCPLSKSKPFLWDDGTHANDWFVHLLWLAGLQNSAQGKFYEDPPSTSSLKVSTESPNKILIADRNTFYRGNGYGWSNHAGGQVFCTELSEFLTFVKSGNRMYVDCHVESVRLKEMGANGQNPIGEDPRTSRFSHSGSARPYYW